MAQYKIKSKGNDAVSSKVVTHNYKIKFTVNAHAQIHYLLRATYRFSVSLINPLC